MHDKSAIIRNFSKSACQYDEYADIQRFAANRLIDEIPKDNFRRILEIGCGTGIYTQLLTRRFGPSRITAVDISEKMIRVARENIKAENVELETGDAEEMAFGQGYDLITSNSVFHWFKSIEKAVLRFSGILNTGGWLVFSAFGPSTFAELAASLKKVRKEYDLFVASRDFWGKERLESMLANFFTQISIEEVSVQREYSSLAGLLREIKYTGTQGCAARGSYVWTRGLLDAIENTYMNDEGRIIATYQIFLCRALK